MPEYSRWAAKVRKTPFTWKNTIKTSFRQLFALSSSDNEFVRLPSDDDPSHQPDAIENTGVEENFKTYLFKTIDTKFVRKVSFTRMALEKSFKSYVRDKVVSDYMYQIDQFKKDKHIEFGLAGSFAEHSYQHLHQPDPHMELQMEAKAVKTSEKKLVLQVTDPDSKIHDYVVVKCGSPPFDPRFA